MTYCQPRCVLAGKSVMQAAFAMSASVPLLQIFTPGSWAARMWCIQLLSRSPHRWVWGFCLAQHPSETEIKVSRDVFSQTGQGPVLQKISDMHQSPEHGRAREHTSSPPGSTRARKFSRYLCMSEIFGITALKAEHAPPLTVDTPPQGRPRDIMLSQKALAGTCQVLSHQFSGS